MEEINKTEQKEHSFIREKIVYKKRSKIKRFLGFGCGVIVLAVVFGVVSRFFFIISEPFANKMLGISSSVPTQPIRNQITLPSSDGVLTPTSGAMKDEHISPGASQIEIVQGEDEDGLGTVPPNETEQDTTSGLGEFIAIHQEIRRVATNAASAMATITVTTERSDWFEQVYEESSTLRV